MIHSVPIYLLDFLTIFSIRPKHYFTSRSLSLSTGLKPIMRISTSSIIFLLDIAVQFEDCVTYL